MTLRINYQSRAFPSGYGVPSGTLTTSWNELLWAAITIGRPSMYHVFRHGSASFYEALFRLSLVRMAVKQGAFRRLRRTGAFTELDPTEKGMVSYFMGMTLCKLFAWRLLHTPWLLHLDVFRPMLNPVLHGRSRPDLVGDDIAGRWHAFESKGRSGAPSSDDRQRAKTQARRLVSVDGTRCSLHIGSFAFFKSDELQFYWRDPDADATEPIALPRPDREWRYYYEPALSFASAPEDAGLASTREMTDVTVVIHPKILELLIEGQWRRARETAKEMRELLLEEGYQPDGVRVIAGESWSMELR